MAANKILINRAPVLTLWASVVAERLGFKHDEALSLGKAVAGLTAQSKGQRLGIFKPTPKELKKVREHERGEEFRVELLGRALPAVNTDHGVRAGWSNPSRFSQVPRSAVRRRPPAPPPRRSGRACQAREMRN